MSTTQLPPLPEKSYLGADTSYGYDEQDMRDYALAALASVEGEPFGYVSKAGAFYKPDECGEGDFKKHATAVYTRPQPAQADAAQGGRVPDVDSETVPLAWRSTREGLVAYVLQDELHNRLTPRVTDIAYSAFMSGAVGKNKEDGGKCDWFNDTKPMVLEAIGKIQKDLLDSPPASQEQAQQPIAAPVPVRQCSECSITHDLGACEQPAQAEAGAVGEPGYGALWRYGDRSRGDLSPDDDGRPQPAAVSAEGVNEMRISMVAQVHELISTLEQLARTHHDPDARRNAEGCIRFARHVTDPFNYNGPYRAANKEQANG
jgi:hypothetical protein